MNINVKEYLQSKHVGYIQKYHVRKHAYKGIVYNSMWVKYLLDILHVSINYYTNKLQHKNKKRELEGQHFVILHNFLIFTMQKRWQ